MKQLRAEGWFAHCALQADFWLLNLLLLRRPFDVCLVARVQLMPPSTPLETLGATSSPRAFYRVSRCRRRSITLSPEHAHKVYV